jgi:hypothetical protein
MFASGVIEIIEGRLSRSLVESALYLHIDIARLLHTHTHTHTRKLAPACCISFSALINGSAARVNSSKKSANG